MLRFLIISGFIVVAILFVLQSSVFVGSAYYLGRIALVPLGLLFAYIAYRKKWHQWSIAHLVLVVGILGHYAYQQVSYEQLPHLKTENLEGKLKVMTYNLLFASKTGNKTLQTIREIPVDVYVFQEFTPEWKQRLQGVLGKTHPYQYVLPAPHAYGAAIYSRYPLKNQERLGNEGTYTYAQCAVVQHPKQEIYLCNLHLASPAIAVEQPDRFFSLYTKNAQTRATEWANVMDLLAKQKAKYPIQVVLGDANTPTYEPLYHQMRQDMADVHAEIGKGFGFTFPNTSRFAPFLRLDYVFLKGNISAQTIAVLPRSKSSSDHLPIVSRLVF